MEDDKKSCCGLHKVGKIGRAVILGCGVFAILLVGFSLGAGFSHERNNGFNKESYRFEGGCGRHNDRGGERFNRQQNVEAGCGMRAINSIPNTGGNFERPLNQNDFQVMPIEINPASPVVTTTGVTIIK